MINIKRTERIRNDRILDTYNRKSLADLVIEHQLQTLGHWLKKEDSSIKKFAFYTTNRERYHRGRPRHTYVKLTK